MTRLIVVEPFYGGSHRQLIDTILKEFASDCPISARRHDVSGCDVIGAKPGEGEDDSPEGWDSDATTTQIHSGEAGGTPFTKHIHRGSISVELYTLPAKKWHWKARVSALYFSQIIASSQRDGHQRQQDGLTSTTSTAHLQADDHQSPTRGVASNSPGSPGSCDILFCSSVLNLAELVSLRPDLRDCRKLIYFHENQLQYPVQKSQQRDFQYGYNQILSSLVADRVLFNSSYNMNSFLDGIPGFLRQIPYQRPDASAIQQQLRLRSQVLPFVVRLPRRQLYADRWADAPLHIVWPHRWEHDKNPETFFQSLFELEAAGYEFRLSVLGESFQDVPEIFETARVRLHNRILHWGYQSTKEDYYRALASGHVAVSTARHEFFGVAMLEAVHLGCYPIAPHDLAYPEHFPEECLYRTKAQLLKKLRYFCRYPQRTRNLEVDVSVYSWESLRERYLHQLGLETAENQKLASTVVGAD